MGKASHPSAEAKAVDQTSVGALSRLMLVVTSNPLPVLIVLALLARFAVIILTIVGGERFVEDDSTYSKLASDYANDNLATWSPFEFSLWRATVVFLWPLSKLYEIFGQNDWVGQGYVAVWGVATAVLVFLVARRFLPTSIALFTGVAISLLPSQVLWSSLLLKDALVWVCFVFLALICAHACASNPRRLWLLSLGILAGLAALAFLREHSFLVASWAFFISMFAGRRDTRLIRVSGAGIVLLILPSLTGIGPAGYTLLTDPNLAERRLNNAAGARSAYISAQGLNEEEEDESPPQDSVIATQELEQVIQLLDKEQDELANLREAKNETNDSAAAEAINSRILETKERIRNLRKDARKKAKDMKDLTETPSEVAGPEASLIINDTATANLAHLPRGISVMLFEPVPWRTPTSTNMQLARLETLAWYPLMMLALIGLWPSRKHLGVMAFPILAGGGMLIVYSLAEGNVGTAFRHRGEFVWAVVLLAGLGLKTVMDRKRRA